MIIDIHSHAYKNFVTPFCSPEELIAKYDRMGTDKQEIYDKITYKNAMKLLEL